MIMEIVFRAKEKELYDLFVEFKEDGSTNFTIRTKNQTGESSFRLSEDDFNLLCDVRVLALEKK
jgi:hypothetical protein